MRVGLYQPIGILLRADRRDATESGADATDRRAVPGGAFLWCPPDGGHLRRRGYVVGRKRVRCLMAKMGLTAIHQQPRTSEPHPAHRTYKFLLRHLKIDRPDHVWCAVITYIPMRRGFLYLVAVMDWATRKVLAWRLSNTMDAECCTAALEEAMAWFEAQEIFNTDQGSQLTSPRFTEVLKDAGVRISMVRRGRWMDNVFIERLSVR
jgi:putative transposase